MSENFNKKNYKFSNVKYKNHENGKDRDGEDNKDILSGLKPVLELLEFDYEKIDQIYMRRGHQSSESHRILDHCKDKHIHFSLVNDEALNRLCHGKNKQNSHHINHQGVLAKLKSVKFLEAESLMEQAFSSPLPLIVALDQVLDPGNVGTLVRTLYALGVAGLIVPKHNSAFLGAGAKRSAAGALEKLPIAEVVNLARCVEIASKSGFTTYAAQVGGLNAIFSDVSDDNEQKLKLPALLVLGSEEKGIRQNVQKQCMHKISIPFLRDFDSLNVAQAGAILVSCFLRAYKLDTSIRL